MFMLRYLRGFPVKDVGGHKVVHSHLPPLNSSACARFVRLHLVERVACADGATVRAGEVSNRVAKALSLTDEDLAVLLPSGKAKLFYNRTGWARSYLLKAGLLSQPKHAFYQITDRALQTLAAGLDRIDVNYLKQFPEFLAFVAPSKPAAGGDVGDGTEGCALSGRRFAPRLSVRD